MYYISVYIRIDSFNFVFRNQTPECCRIVTRKHWFTLVKDSEHVRKIYLSKTRDIFGRDIFRIFYTIYADFEYVKFFLKTDRYD